MTPIFAGQRIAVWESIMNINSELVGPPAGCTGELRGLRIERTAEGDACTPRYLSHEEERIRAQTEALDRAEAIWVALADSGADLETILDSLGTLIKEYHVPGATIRISVSGRDPPADT